MSKAIRKDYGIDVDPALLEPGRTGPHLDLKIEVRDDENNVVAAGRGGDVLKRMEDERDAGERADKGESPWEGAFASYRKSGLAKWPDDDLNAPIELQ